MQAQLPLLFSHKPLIEELIDRHPRWWIYYQSFGENTFIRIRTISTKTRDLWVQIVVNTAMLSDSSIDVVDLVDHQLELAVRKQIEFDASLVSY